MDMVNGKQGRGLLATRSCPWVFCICTVTNDRGVWIWATSMKCAGERILIGSKLSHKPLIGMRNNPYFHLHFQRNVWCFVQTVGLAVWSDIWEKQRNKEQAGKLCRYKVYSLQNVSLIIPLHCETEPATLHHVCVYSYWCLLSGQAPLHAFALDN